MKRVAIVIPSWHYWADPVRIQPVQELYLATIIEQRFSSKGVHVSIIDLRGVDPKDRPAHLSEEDMYIYWVMKTGDYPEIRDCVKTLRLHYPKAIHVAGGTHVSLCMEECSRIFDTVISGPGEEAICNGIERMLSDTTTEKTYYQDYDKVHFADYPIMQRHFLPKTAIVNHLLFEKYGDKIPSTCVLFSRGCNFKCLYCVYNVPDKMQFRRPEDITAEIEYLKKEYGVKAVNLKDEIALPAWLKTCHTFLDAIGMAHVLWRGQTTLWGATDEHLRRAAQSGCVEFAIGVESASSRAREIIHKKISDEEIFQFIERSHRYGIKIKMCLILGLPGEPMDIVQKTIDFIHRAKPDYVSVSGFDPFPGSYIFNNKEVFGIKSVDEDWSRHAHLLYRFGDEEEVGLPFEYFPETPWGKSFTRDQIVQNIQDLQQMLRERKMSY